MDKKRNAAASQVIQLPRSKETGRKSEKKWGKAVMALGFCIVPSLLLRAQGRLGLNPTQLAILLQLCDFWWDPQRNPYPSKRLLGERLGLSPRQVQRHIAALEGADLVRRVERRSSRGGKQSNEYNLDGLVARLKKLEPDFRKVEEDAKKARREVSQRGYRLRQIGRVGKGDQPESA